MSRRLLASSNIANLPLVSPMFVLSLFAARNAREASQIRQLGHGAILSIEP
jgi:hypothetical protein